MMIKRILTATKPNKSPELNAIIFEYSYMPVEYRPTSTSIGTAAINRYFIFRECDLEVNKNNIDAINPPK